MTDFQIARSCLRDGLRALVFRRGDSRRAIVRLESRAFWRALGRVLRSIIDRQNGAPGT